MQPGTRYILLSTTCFFIATLFVKYIPHIPAYEIVLVRAIISLILCSAIIAKQKVPFWGQHKRLLILRGLFGTAGLLSFFYALQNLPLATASTLINLYPIFTIIFAIFILNEKPKPKQWLFFATAFIGVTFLKGGSMSISFQDFFIGAMSGLFAGIAYNVIRLLKGKEAPITVILYLSLVAVPVFLPLAIWQWAPPTLFEWTMLLGIGVITQIAQWFLTKAHQAAQASHIVHYSYFSVVASVIVGWWWFDEPLTAIALLGIGLIMGSILMINRYKYR